MTTGIVDNEVRALLDLVKVTGWRNVTVGCPAQNQTMLSTLPLKTARRMTSCTNRRDVDHGK
jgi:hypothetical protein